MDIPLFFMTDPSIFIVSAGLSGSDSRCFRFRASGRLQPAVLFYHDTTCARGLHPFSPGDDDPPDLFDVMLYQASASFILCAA